jgi:hypothetical protein
MVHHRCSITIEQLIDHAVVDGDGMVLVPLLDVLALGRIDADAQLVSLDSASGASYVLRVAEIIERDDLFLRLTLCEVTPGARPSWSLGLWSLESGLSDMIVSMRAMSFASFVGRE